MTLLTYKVITFMITARIFDMVSLFITKSVLAEQNTIFITETTAYIFFLNKRKII